jgi:REP element-mobilizing transposase RayT
MWGLINNKNCHLYRINGMQDHLHILTSLHPTLCLSKFVKDIKISSSKWIKENRIFPRFKNWQDGYGAFTVSYGHKDRVIRYIINQQQHHRKKTFIEEYRGLLEEMGIEFDEKYLL